MTFGLSEHQQRVKGRYARNDETHAEADDEREASNNGYMYDCNNNGLSNGTILIVARIMMVHVPSLYFLMIRYQRGL
jgi:hypothetical protein